MACPKVLGPGQKLSVLVLLLGVTVFEVKGHVSLTFPPARNFPIDFLNNFWTKQPCGQPKGLIKTRFDKYGELRCQFVLLRF